jgi:hypothetical protein
MAQHGEEEIVVRQNQRTSRDFLRLPRVRADYNAALTFFA